METPALPVRDRNVWVSSVHLLLWLGPRRQHGARLPLEICERVVPEASKQEHAVLCVRLDFAWVFDASVRLGACSDAAVCWICWFHFGVAVGEGGALSGDGGVKDTSVSYGIVCSCFQSVFFAILGTRQVIHLLFSSRPGHGIMKL